MILNTEEMLVLNALETGLELANWMELEMICVYGHFKPKHRKLLNAEKDVTEIEAAILAVKRWGEQSGTT